jgi:hypothetical protein
MLSQASRLWASARQVRQQYGLKTRAGSAPASSNSLIAMQALRQPVKPGF